MELDELISTRDAYLEQLETLNGVKFTQKQIDVIAFLISGRTNKVIASILSIGDKAVEHRIRGISLKLNCNGRQGIIDFIQTSGKAELLRSYGLFLQKCSEFKKCLAEVSKLKRVVNEDCLIIHWKHKDLEGPFLSRFKEHLELAGMNVSIKTRTKQSSYLQLIKESRNDNYVIYMLPEILWEETEANLKKRTLTAQNITGAQHNCLFLLSRKESDKQFDQVFSDFNYIDITEQKHYFFMVFEILKRFFPPEKVDHIVSKAKMLNETTENPINIVPPKVLIQNPHSFFSYLKPFSRKKVGVLLLMLSFIGLGGGGLFIFSKSSEKQTHQEENPIRSDFILPNESTLLQRPEIIEEIDEKLKSQKGIQTIALIGPGGAGKTTLARQYARSQNLPLVWEINAENHETLVRSFEKLADALSKSEDDKNTLRGLQEIKNSTEKEEKLLQFVKEKLKALPTWFLVYDNVEMLKDIQPYFPIDANTWGKGVALVTTQNSNTQNDGYICHSLLIGELNANQKLDLFLKVIKHGQSQNFTTDQNQEIQQFLEKIPPFPLDVSVAAYYIKSTSVPYEKYLTYVNDNSKDFEAVQADLLSDYTKTRYGIITLSLQKLMETHKDFGDLLLFISLIDSQNIPRDLLVKYKNDPIVDHFVYHLKKYSLLTNEVSLPSPFDSTISFHRSTQAIILDYLKTLDLGETKTRIQSISNSLEQVAEQELKKEKTPHIKALLNHFNAFLSHGKFLNPSTKSLLTFELGRMYGHLSQYEKAKDLLEQSLEILEKQGKEKDIKFAQVSAYLGSVYKELANPQKSQELLEQSLLIYNKNPQENQGEIARTLAYLGDTYRNKDDFKKAKSTLEESVRLYKQHTPIQYPGLALALTNLGATQRELRNIKAAIQALEESLFLYRKYSPENFMGIARALYYLGPSYASTGDFKKAQSILEESINLFKKHSSKDNILIGRALVRLGNVYRELGEYKHAKDIFEQAFVIHKVHHTKEHVQYAWPLLYIGFINRELGAPQKAKFLLEQCLDTYKKHYGEEDINVAWISSELASIHNDLHNYDLALKLLEKSLPIHEKTYGKDHAETASVLRILAQTYLQKGDLKTAETHLKNILMIFQESKLPDVYKAYEDLADLELKKAKNEESQGSRQQAAAHKAQASTYLIQALEVVKNAFPASSPHLIRIQGKLWRGEIRIDSKGKKHSHSKDIFFFKGQLRWGMTTFLTPHHKGFPNL